MISLVLFFFFKQKTAYEMRISDWSSDVCSSDLERGHAINPRTSVSLPVTAAAAAIAGLTRWVRAPGPWRPTKLRLLVEAQRSPAGTLSGFIARQAEQPGSRHSSPALVKMRSSPSASACALTSPEPGTTIAHLTLSALCRPLITAAAARRSSMRLLVQLPMKIFSTGTSCIRVPGSRPMYASDLAAAACFDGSAKLSGAGTTPVIGTTSSGLVPQVTLGAMSAASMTTLLSRSEEHTSELQSL